MKRLAVLLIAALIVIPAAMAQPVGQGDAKKKPKFTLSKETTYVLGPLDNDGYIDYVAALNEKLREGVTPENNANVLLLKALGPRPEGAPMPAEFYKLLGIDAPPEGGNYFVTLHRYAKKIDPEMPGGAWGKLAKQLDAAMSRPWKSKQYAELFQWIQVNAKPLDLIVEAAKRTHFYSPFVTTKTRMGLPIAPRSDVFSCRELAEALTTRAMLRLGNGQADDAWLDLLTCHRLGRLISHGGKLVDLLTGVSVDFVASEADLVYLENAKLSAKQLKGKLTDLQKLRERATVVNTVDLGERVSVLETVQGIQRHGIEYLESVQSWGKPLKPFNPLTNFGLLGAEWDPALHNVNQWFDRITVALRHNKRRARDLRLEQIRKELIFNKLKDPAKLPLGTASNRAKAISDVVLNLVVPGFHKSQHAAERLQQVQRNLHIAFALAAYQKDNGKYPKQLAALTPMYLPEVPLDLFSGEALIYQPAEKGYVLYSVGPNGKDEQGRTYDDNPPGDDIVVRMPLPKLSKN